VRRGEIFRLLQSAVLTGGFPPGSTLPPERELMQRYGVTRTTIRRALAKLTASGHLTCRSRIGYQVAPAIRQGRPMKGLAIGFILFGMPELGHGPFAVAVEQAVADAGHVLMIGASGNDAQREDDVIRRLAAAGMEGLIVTPACNDSRQVGAAGSGTAATELEKWIRDGHPVVLQGHPGRWLLSDAVVRLSNIVDMDNADGMRQILARLAERGHRTAGFVCQDPFMGSERFAVFQSFAPEYGLRTRPEWCFENAGRTPESVRAALAGLSLSGTLPTAMVCSHDDAALALRDMLARAGCACPEQISITGFENRSLNGSVTLATLTTVDSNSAMLAHETMRLLARQFAGLRESPEKVRVPVSLLDRGSIGPAPAAASGRVLGKK